MLLTGIDQQQCLDPLVSSLDDLLLSCRCAVQTILPKCIVRGLTAGIESGVTAVLLCS